jgi:hypothetical protein
VVTEETIRSVFAEFGEVKDVALKKSTVNVKSQEQSGYGFIHFFLTVEGMYAAIEATIAIRQIMIKGDILFDSCLTHSLEAIIDRYKQDGTIQPVSLSAANAYYSKMQLTSPNSIATSSMVGLHPSHQQHLLQQQQEEQQQGQLRERGDYLRPAVQAPAPASSTLSILPHQQMSFQQYEQLHLQQQRAGTGTTVMNRYLPSSSVGGGRGGFSHEQLQQHQQQQQFDRRSPNSSPYQHNGSGSPLNDSPHSDSRAMTQVYPPPAQQQQHQSQHQQPSRGMWSGNINQRDGFLPTPPVAERYSSYPGAGGHREGMNGRGGDFRRDGGGYAGRREEGSYAPLPPQHDFRDEMNHRMMRGGDRYAAEEDVYEDTYYPTAGNQFPSQHSAAMAHHHHQQQYVQGRPPFPRNATVVGGRGEMMRESPPNSFYHHNTPTNSFYDNSNNSDNRHPSSSPASSYSHSSSFIYQTSSGAVSSGSALPSPAGAAFPNSFFPPTPNSVPIHASQHHGQQQQHQQQQHQQQPRGSFFASGSHSSWNLNESGGAVHDDHCNYSPRKDSVGSHTDEMINGIASDITNLNITNPFSQIEAPPAVSSVSPVSSTRSSLSSTVSASSPSGPRETSSSAQHQLQHKEEGQAAW